MLLNEVEVHPICAAFPMMTDEEFEGLVIDMEKQGQQVPVTFWQGMLVDGRNRLKACEVLCCEPYTCELESDVDVVPWIISKNLHRRHLTESQRAMVAHRLREHFDREAKQRQQSGLKRGTEKPVAVNLPEREKMGDSRDKAGAAVGVSGSLVDHAKKVVEAGIPELTEAVTTGKVAVSRASKIADLPPADQLEAIDNPPERVKRPAKEIVADLIAKALNAGDHQAALVAKSLFDQLDDRQRQTVCQLWIEWYEAEVHSHAQ
jgi:hypothetical protein